MREAVQGAIAELRTAPGDEMQDQKQMSIQRREMRRDGMQMLGEKGGGGGGEWLCSAHLGMCRQARCTVQKEGRDAQPGEQEGQGEASRTSSRYDHGKVACDRPSWTSAPELAQK